jgi:hypothetical protein
LEREAQAARCKVGWWTCRHLVGRLRLCLASDLKCSYKYHTCAHLLPVERCHSWPHGHQWQTHLHSKKVTFNERGSESFSCSTLCKSSKDHTVSDVLFLKIICVRRSTLHAEPLYVIVKHSCLIMLPQMTCLWISKKNLCPIMHQMV